MVPALPVMMLVYLGGSADIAPELDAEIVPSMVLAPERGIGLRRHRGDWEPPTGALFVFEPYWLTALSQMVDIAQEEVDVWVLVSRERYAEARRWIRAERYPKGRVKLVQAALDTPWVRDFGPLQVDDLLDGSVWIDAPYFDGRDADDVIPRLLSAKIGIPLEPLDAPLEGGALISNGHGLCVMTADSFGRMRVDPNDVVRRDDILHRLGCNVLSVVPQLPAEPTGHIDIIAQFLSPTKVVVGEVDAGRYPKVAESLHEVLRGLRMAAVKLGERLEIVRVPLPIVHDSYRPYANSLRLPSSLLVPSYRDVSEAVETRALDILQRAAPELRVVPIPSDDLIEQDGAIHCVSVGLALPVPKPATRARH